MKKVIILLLFSVLISSVKIKAIEEIKNIQIENSLNNPLTISPFNNIDFYNQYQNSSYVNNFVVKYSIEGEQFTESYGEFTKKYPNYLKLTKLTVKQNLSGSLIDSNNLKLTSEDSHLDWLITKYKPFEKGEYSLTYNFLVKENGEFVSSTKTVFTSEIKVTTYDEKNIKLNSYPNVVKLLIKLYSYDLNSLDFNEGCVGNKITANCSQKIINDFIEKMTEWSKIIAGSLIILLSIQTFYKKALLLDCFRVIEVFKLLIKIFLIWLLILFSSEMAKQLWIISSAIISSFQSITDYLGESELIKTVFKDFNNLNVEDVSIWTILRSGTNFFVLVAISYFLMYLQFVLIILLTFRIIKLAFTRYLIHLFLMILAPFAIVLLIDSDYKKYGFFYFEKFIFNLLEGILVVILMLTFVYLIPVLIEMIKITEISKQLNFANNLVSIFILIITYKMLGKVNKFIKRITVVRR